MLRPRSLVCLAVMTAAVLSFDRASAQTVRLRFLNPLKDDTAVSGPVTLRVSEDPILRPKSIRVGIQVDGKLLETAQELPWSYVWDSSTAKNGPHLVQLVLVNTRSHETGFIETMRLRTFNSPNTAQKQNDFVSARSPRREDSNSTLEEEFPLARRGQSGTEPGRVPQREETIGTGFSGLLQADCTEAVVARTKNALELIAASLQLDDGKLLIGRRDGTLTAFDPASRDGWSVMAPRRVGSVLRAARGGGITTWLCEDETETSNRAKSLVRARWLFIYGEHDRKIRTYDLFGIPFSVRSAAIWKGRILLTGASGALLLDPTSETVEEMNSIVTEESEVSLRGMEVTACVSGDGAIIVAASRTTTAYGGLVTVPGQINAWSNSGDKWTPISIPDLTEAGSEPVRQTVAVSDQILLGTGTTVVGINIGHTGRLYRAQFPMSDQTGRPTTQLTASESQLWCIRGTTLFHMDATTGEQDVFLPWNLPGLVPQAIAPDRNALWIATNRGIKRLELSRSDPVSGYAGFIRVRLGAGQDTAYDEGSRRLAEEIDSWQGVPYVWGGVSRSGVDCSGFVMRAFQASDIWLNHGSDYLRSCRQGLVVKDELRYGDVLVFPGHCAIYTGGGTTSETINKSVGRSSIWRRSDVVVRRFLGVAEPQGPSPFASRSGNRGPRKRAVRPTSRHK